MHRRIGIVAVHRLVVAVIVVVAAAVSESSVVVGGTLNTAGHSLSTVLGGRMQSTTAAYETVY